MVGGFYASPEKTAGGPFSISSVRQVLRQRCDARGFTPLPIEIIAGQKVAPTFESQKIGMDGWLKLLIDDRKGSRDWTPRSQVQNSV
jgi:hypothetical protein